MSQDFLFSLSALIALLPAAAVGIRGNDGRDGLFWSTLAVAVAGPTVWTGVQILGTWQAGLSATLWATISVSMILFALIAIATRQAWRLTALMVPYLAILATLALVLQQVPARPLNEPVGIWLEAHIAASVITYGLVTIAAVAALAALLQERALKAKRPTAFTERLPSVADCETLLVRLLVASEAILALGLATGMATLYRERGTIIAFDHKTVLSMTAFVVIGGLLAAHFHSGTRGRTASRWVLLAYLLMTLGYPGVKFVTDVLMA